MGTAPHEVTLGTIGELDVAPGITLLIIGAILAFAVRSNSSWINVHMVGVIFMVGGAAIIAYFRKERHVKEVVKHVQHGEGTDEPYAVVEETIHETVYPGDESPPVVPRSIHGYEQRR